MKDGRFPVSKQRGRTRLEESVPKCPSGMLFLWCLATKYLVCHCQSFLVEVTDCLFHNCTAIRSPLSGFVLSGTQWYGFKNIEYYWTCHLCDRYDLQQHSEPNVPSVCEVQSKLPTKYDPLDKQSAAEVPSLCIRWILQFLVRFSFHALFHSRLLLSRLFFLGWDNNYTCQRLWSSGKQYWRLKYSPRIIQWYISDMKCQFLFHGFSRFT